jgi:hypothetical protein
MNHILARYYTCRVFVWGNWGQGWTVVGAQSLRCNGQSSLKARVRLFINYFNLGMCTSCVWKKNCDHLDFE